MQVWQIFLNFTMAALVAQAFYKELRNVFQHSYHIIFYVLHLYFVAFSFRKDRIHYSLIAAIIFQVRTLFALVEDPGKLLRPQDKESLAF